jgi:hypothetical protein
MSAPVKRGTRRTTRLRKLECDCCGLILRAAFNPVQAVGLPGCACTGTFRWEHADDAGAAGDYDHPGVAAAMRADDARLKRADRSADSGHRMRCGGCRRWVRSARENCSCGFANDIRGGRNRGGFADAASW